MDDLLDEGVLLQPTVGSGVHIVRWQLGSCRL